MPENIKENPKPQKENEVTKEKSDSSKSKGEKIDPTRYGDWERGGRCIDF